MDGQLEQGGRTVQITLGETQLAWKLRQEKRAPKGGNKLNTVNIADIICAEHLDCKGSQLHITYISQQEPYLLRRKSVYFDGPADVCKSWVEAIEQALNGVECRPRKLLLIVCPVSGFRKSLTVLETLMKPIFHAAKIETDIVVTEAKNHAYNVLLEWDLRQYDGVVSAGGDGLLQEVVSGAFEQTQKQHNIDLKDPDCIPKPLDIPISPIPVGTGNGMAFVCFGTKDVETAILAIVKGKRKKTNLISVYSGNKHVTYAMMFIIYGFLVEAAYNMDRRRMSNRFTTLCHFMYDFFTSFKRERQEWEMEVRYLKCTEKDSTQKTPLDQREYEWVSASGRYCLLMLCTFHALGGMKTAHLRGLENMDSSMFLMEPIGRYRFIKFALAFNGMAPSGFQHEAIHHESIKQLEVKLKATAAPGSIAETVLDVDGEMYNLEEKGFSVRYYHGILTMFDGFPSEEEEKTETQDQSVLD